MSGARHPGELIVPGRLRMLAPGPAATKRFRVRAMAKAIFANRVCFASKELKMFMLQVRAT